MEIKDLLRKELMIMDLKASTKMEAIDEMIEKLKTEGIISDADEFKKLILAREEKSSTGIGEGIAIPHAKTEFVKEPALAMGRKMSGIDYDSLDGEPATLFFMIAAPDGANNTHIETLARLSQLLLDDDFKEALENAKTSDEVLEIINKAEAEKFAEVHFAMEAVKNASDIRTDKVEEMKAKLKDPSYFDNIVNSLADKIMEAYGI